MTTRFQLVHIFCLLLCLLLSPVDGFQAQKLSSSALTSRPWQQICSRDVKRKVPRSIQSALRAAGNNPAANNNAKQVSNILTLSGAVSVAELLVKAWKKEYISLSSVLYLVSTYLVKSAADRSRLDASTFKMLCLSLGSVSSFKMYTFMSTFNKPSAVSVMGIIGKILSAVASIGVLRQHGIPKLKISAKPTEILHVTYLGSAAISLIFGITHAPISWPLYIGTMPFMLCALSGAALAGPKRLNSQTYKVLNTSMLITSLYYLLPRLLLGGRISISLVTLYSLSLASSSVGLYRGLTYRGS